MARSCRCSRRRRHLRNKPVEQQSTNSQLVNSVIDRHQHLRTLALTEHSAFTRRDIGTDKRGAVARRRVRRAER